MIRPTHQPTRATHYRRPGGPWDTAPLDGVLADDPRIAAVAGGLRQAGVRRGDAVAWQLPNVDAAVLLYRACWRLGAVAVPVHHQAGPAEVDRMLAAVEPRLVVDGETLPDGPPVAVTATAARPSDVAAVLFTSGSTGAPKAVLHTQRALAYKAGLMRDVHGLTADDAVLMPAPLAHISGLLNGILVAGAARMRTVLMAKWDPEHALQLIEQHRISFMIGPPTFFIGLMGAPGFNAERVASLRLISSGGAGVSPAFVAEASERIGALVKRTYGSTEAPTMTTSLAGDPVERARQTDGRPVGEVELKLGANDELLVRGPELFAGYADPTDNEGAFSRGGWFHTGDRASIDADGWLTITGRIKDMVIRGGENISVAEVEAVLEAHPAVRHAVAVGYPDERLGERLAAVVVADDGFDVDACRQWFETRGVARFKTPERVLVITEMPTLAAGKPDRAAIRSLVTPTA
ncbi:MAG TPA: AMP-binding protein [Acidimicrobiales bacterium]|nr:AMP-binding protein [Acidimicrobiales bacterium]